MATILDMIFVFLLSFAATFTWCRYYLKNSLVCLGIALVCAMCLVIVFRFFYTRKKKKKVSKALAASEKEQLLVHLALSEQSVEMFRSVFEAGGYEITEYGSCFLAKKNENQILVGINFLLRPLNAQDLVPMVRLCDFHGVSGVLFCGAISNEVRGFIGKSRAPVKLYDIDSAADFLRTNNAFPELPKKQLKKQRQFISRAMKRDRSRRYFFCALFFLLTSFISFYKLYYLISASILLMIALYARFNTRFNVSPTPDFIL